MQIESENVQCDECCAPEKVATVALHNYAGIVGGGHVRVCRSCLKKALALKWPQLERAKITIKRQRLGLVFKARGGGTDYVTEIELNERDTARTHAKLLENFGRAV